VRSLKHWNHYLVAIEFILHSNREALKYIQGQHKLNSQHAKRVEYVTPPTARARNINGFLLHT